MKPKWCALGCFVRSLFGAWIVGSAFLPGLAFGQAFDSSYAVELSRGPVVAPSRIVGMGGAFVSIAEGAGAYDLNPAAAGIRHRHNKDELWDWDFALEAIVSPRDSADFENSRRSTSRIDDLTVGYASLGFVAEQFGFGVAISASSLEVKESADATPIVLTGGTLSVDAAYNFMDGQLVMGGGLYFGSATAARDELAFLDFFGLGLVVGGVAQPKGEPYRFGFTLRSRARLSPQEGTTPGLRMSGILAPTAFVLPAQLTVGMAYSIGSRANNVTATFGTRDPRPEDALPKARDFMTIAADVVITERLDLAAGFQAWADDELQVAGEEVTVGLHVGVEGEIIDNRLKTRLGFYFEPSRFDDVGRVHATSGFDLRLFELIWDWKVAAAADLARGYTNIILSVGFWH